MKNKGTKKKSERFTLEVIYLVLGMLLAVAYAIYVRLDSPLNVNVYEVISKEDEYFNVSYILNELKGYIIILLMTLLIRKKWMANLYFCFKAFIYNLSIIKLFLYYNVNLAYKVGYVFFISNYIFLYLIQLNECKKYIDGIQNGKNNLRLETKKTNMKKDKNLAIISFCIKEMLLFIVAIIISFLEMRMLKNVVFS